MGYSHRRVSRTIIKALFYPVLQVENEYGSVEEDGTIPDLDYMKAIKKLYEDHGLVELFFTSDTPSLHGAAGALPGMLQTANFKVDTEKELNLLKELQPDKPAMVMEYWTGWFDHWLEPYHGGETVEGTFTLRYFPIFDSFQVYTMETEFFFSIFQHPGKDLGLPFVR